MKEELPLALLLAAPYALLAGGAALWLRSEPWMVLVLWALIFLLIFLKFRRAASSLSKKARK